MCISTGDKNEVGEVKSNINTRINVYEFFMNATV